MPARDATAGPSARPPSVLTASTAFLVKTVARRADDLLAGALVPLGLRPRHFVILATLAEDGAASQHTLGRRLGIDRTTMVAAMDELERLRLVTRQQDPEDRRAYRVELTSRGRTTLVRATGAVAAAEALLLAALAPDERAAFCAALERISPSPSSPASPSPSPSPSET